MQVITKLADRVRYVLSSRRRRRDLAIAQEMAAQGAFEVSDLVAPVYRNRHDGVV